MGRNPKLLAGACAAARCWPRARARLWHPAAADRPLIGSRDAGAGGYHRPGRAVRAMWQTSPHDKSGPQS